MAANPQENTVEFRVTIKGLELSPEQQVAMDAAIRRAVLSELADIDVGPEHSLLLRGQPEPEQGAESAMFDSPGVVPFILGLIIEIARPPGAEH